MLFPSPLIEATLKRRYKRFLADCILADGTEITASVPNTGSMLGLTDPGSRIWLSHSDNPKLKYEHRLQIVEADDTMVGINTGLPNKLAEEAIARGLVSDLADYPVIRREQKYGANSRIDILLEGNDRVPAYVEVKNVHFMRTRGLAEFPDSVTARGAKHLHELAAMRAQGSRAIMIYMIQRNDCLHFQLCGDLDPAYAAAFNMAREAGVEAYAVACSVSDKEIVPVRLLEFCS